MTKWLRGLILAGLILIIAIFGLKWTRQNMRNAMPANNSRISPIILVPGSSATQERFDAMVNELNQNTHTTSSLLKVTVHPDDHLSYSGQFRPGIVHPYIVIAFANNKDGYSNIKKQTQWFQHAMLILTARYHFNNFSAIGHSNGGLVLTRYLEKYFNRQKLRMNTLMTIASPFNFSETNINKRTQMLSDLVRDKSKIPSNLVMYSVAGTENYNNDGTVPFASVEAGKYIYQDQAKSYTQITVTGEDTTHHDLPQNREIVSLIQQYILGNPNKNPQPEVNVAPQ
ncbi:cell surface hydrolase (putative) [Pediococcus damnosus]|uniref:Cell surface hydrolase (Putative) n=2 Tax=Pediococcus damnosus TaxID=51663 RepID=A0ABM6A4U1_9LACO|nr:alpha/beta hydrolase [Pediococcus damnosus]AMV67296.1 cell surface hydrolase (putative) [Pediococcus damnosus]PJE49133.1 alpha/beta hydrolase [Pediococcus damnosus]